MPVKIQLKSIKVHLALSQETYAYYAKLYADDRYIADVGNAGCGGADRVLKYAPGVTAIDFEEIKQRVAAEHPKEKLFDDRDELYDADIEGICHKLVSDHLDAKELRRLTKNKVVFFKDGVPAEGTTADLFTAGVNLKAGETIPQITQRVKAQHPNCFVLNDLPEWEALTAYKRAN